MGKLVLVLNHHFQTLYLLKDILEDYNYEVKVGLEKDQWWRSVAAINPDLIIIDHIFEDDLEGWQLIQQLKLDKSTSKIPIIFCTAAVQLATKLSTQFRAKNVKVIIKPFDINDLMNAVEASLTPST